MDEYCKLIVDNFFFWFKYFMKCLNLCLILSLLIKYKRVDLFVFCCVLVCKWDEVCGMFIFCVDDDRNWWFVCDVF